MSGFDSGGGGQPGSMGSTASTGEIDDLAVTTAKLADDAVTAAKLADTAVAPGAYTLTSLTVDQQGRITAAASGSAGASLSSQALTAATMTVVSNAVRAATVSVFEWTGAMVRALGGASGNIKVVTLPARTVVANCYVVILSPEMDLISLTVSVGRSASSYIDYIVASNAQASADTVYGDASAERGANMTGYDLPNYAGAVDVYAQFVGVGDTLDNASNCSGRVVIEHYTIP